MALSVNIRKKLGNFDLNVCFEAQNGVLALLGASGSGKSVTLRCIAGIMTPDEGRIVLDGKTLFDSGKNINLPPQKRRVGYLFQQYALFPNMTVRENIGSVFKSGKDRAAETQTLIERFQLESVAELRPSALSGGQQQRAALARILAAKPKILLLDEPFSALDAYLKAQLEQELRDTLDSFGGSVLWVSHDRDEVFRNCERVCVLDAGRSQAVVTPRELFSDPKSVSAAKLSGCKNVVDVKSNGATVSVPEWGLTFDCGRETNGASAVGFRAHYFYFCDSTEKNSLECEVVRTMDNVFSTIVILRPVGSVPGAQTLRIETPKGQVPAPHERVYVAIAPQNILILKQEEK